MNIAALRSFSAPSAVLVGGVRRRRSSAALGSRARVAGMPVARYADGMRRCCWILIALCACGEPILRNAPKPDPGAVAGVAAAAAAAVTLADPQAAAKKQEQKQKGEPDDRGVVVKETVPADVFDRLDQHAGSGSGAAPGDAGIDGAAAR
jgi:hypothetical protein